MKNLVKIYIACFACLFFCVGYVNSAFAILEIEITQGGDSAIAINIDSFDSRISDVIKNDLKNSGRFNLNTQKAEVVVNGKVEQLGGDQFRVYFSLNDVYSGKGKLLEKDFNVKSAQFRSLAHHISDLIYQQLIGDKGIFSTKIAYVLVSRAKKYSRDAIYKLQVADSDGYNPRTLMVSRFPLMSPSWSPDGRKLAYVSFEGNRAAIYVQDIVSGARKVISKFSGINGAPAWSPDGRKMALVLTQQTGYPKIHILDLATNHLERITDGYCSDTEPSWAPDGRTLIFTSDRNGIGSPQIYKTDIYSKKLPDRVTRTGSYNARASYTANGKSIVMLHKVSDMFSIAQQDLESGRVTVLTQFGFNESPSVAPNGKMIVYATNYKDKGRGMLGEVSFDGRVKLLLPIGEGAVQEPAWSPFIKF